MDCNGSEIETEEIFLNLDISSISSSTSDDENLTRIKKKKKKSNSEEKFNFVKCDKVYSREYSLSRRIKTVHSEVELSESNFSHDEYLKCNICDERFSCISSLFHHRIHIHDNFTKETDCDKCSTVYARQDSLVRHEKHIHQEIEFSECNFSHTEYLKCNICDEYFSNASSLYYHQILIHDNCTTKINCDKCGKVFFRQDALARHTKNAHLEKIFSKSNIFHEYFECSECGLKFLRKDNLKNHILHIHAENEFECHHCGRKLKYKKTIMKHLQTQHSNEKRYECTICNEKFSLAFFLSRHQILIHGNPVKKLGCNKCDKIFSRQDNLTRHLKNFHGEEKFSKSNLPQLRNLKCSECKVKFLHKDDLNSHILLRHKDNEFECHHCGVKLRYKQNIIKHLWTIHSNKKRFCDRKTQICALCEYSSQRKIDIQHHYKVQHQVPFIEKQLNFNNYQEFLTWKMGIEDASNSRFVIRNTFKGKTHTVTVFCCHRSGVKRIKSAKRKRRLKLIGSKKLGSVCPAEIRVRYNRINSMCFVSFWDTHVGHDLTNRKEVRTLFLRSNDRAQLAEKIAAGVSLNKILDDYQNDDVLENYLLPNVKRSDLLSNKDLHNIINTYNVKPNDNEPRSFLNDVKNVESFVNRYEQYILYYKKQHEMPPDNRFSALEKEDILLIFMCNAQKLLLQKHGNNVIAIDSTHDLNPYGFILQTILILDYDGEDYPVAFAISNRNDDVVIDVFLSCIKATVGIIQPKTIMTNIQMTYSNSWQKIMSIPQYRLFCIWHVFEAWRKNGKKIFHKEKREQILHKLYELTSEINVDTFIIYLNELLKSADNDTTEFLDYIRTEYGYNVDLWAYCYRLDAGFNTNLHVEAFHRSLKYIHGMGKKINNLCTGLELILNYLRRELNSINIKHTHGRISTKLRHLREIHDKASKVVAENNSVQVMENEDGWSVELLKESEDHVREVYFVQQICEKCPTVEDDDYRECNLMCCECGTCAHIYRCTCIESTVRNNMCQHIHIALMISCKTEDITIAFLNTSDLVKTEDANITYLVSESDEAQIIELRKKKIGR